MAELLNLLILYTISNIMRRVSFPSHYIYHDRRLSSAERFS